MNCHHWTVTAKCRCSARLTRKLLINLNSLHLIKQAQPDRTTECIKAEPACYSVFVYNPTREPCLPSHLYQLSPPLCWLFGGKFVFSALERWRADNQSLRVRLWKRQNSYFKVLGGIVAAGINTILSLSLSNLSKLVQQQKFSLCRAGSAWYHHPRKTPRWVTFYDRNQTGWS